MNKDYETMWKELRQYCARAEVELYKIASRYERDISEQKRVVGKADGVALINSYMSRLEQEFNIENNNSYAIFFVKDGIDNLHAKFDIYTPFPNITKYCQYYVDFYDKIEIWIVDQQNNKIKIIAENVEKDN